MGLFTAVAIGGAFFGIFAGGLLVIVGIVAMGWWALGFLLPLSWGFKAGHAALNRYRVRYDDWLDDQEMGEVW